MGFSETSKADLGEISIGWVHYQWFSPENGANFKGKGAIVGISVKLQPFASKITLIDEHMIQGSLKHRLLFMFLISAYTTQEACKSERKGTSCAKLDTV